MWQPHAAALAVPVAVPSLLGCLLVDVAEANQMFWMSNRCTCSWKQAMRPWQLSNLATSCSCLAPAEVSPPLQGWLLVEVIKLGAPTWVLTALACCQAWLPAWHRSGMWRHLHCC